MYFQKTCQKTLATLVIGLLPVAAVADGEWLAGAAIGNAQVRETFDLATFEPSSTSYRIYGGYQFNDYFGLQAGYLKFESFDESIYFVGGSTRLSVDVDGFTAAAIARVPFAQRFDVHAKIGAFFHDAHSLIDGVPDSTSETDVFFGIGLGFELSDKLSLSLDAERYDLSAVHTNVYSVGLQVRFR